MTLHLPWPLTDCEHSKDDKMSSTCPNSNPLDVMDLIRQGKHMRKIPFLYFEFAQLRHQNPNLTMGQNPQIAI